LLKSLIHKCKQNYNWDVGAHVRLANNVSRNQGVQCNSARPVAWNNPQQSQIRKYRQRQRAQRRLQTPKGQRYFIGRQLGLIFRSVPWTHQQALKFVGGIWIQPAFVGRSVTLHEETWS
jgi:hypothetical protein